MRIVSLGINQDLNERKRISTSVTHKNPGLYPMLDNEREYKPGLIDR